MIRFEKWNNLILNNLWLLKIEKVIFGNSKIMWHASLLGFFFLIYYKICKGE